MMFKYDNKTYAYAWLHCITFYQQYVIQVSDLHLLYIVYNQKEILTEVGSLHLLTWCIKKIFCFESSTSHLLP